MVRLYVQGVFVQNCEQIEIFSINCQIVLQHLYFVWVNVVHCKMFENACSMNCYPSNATEGFDEGFDSSRFKSFDQVKRNRFCNNRIPTLVIELDSFIELGEEEIPLGKILLQLFGDVIVLSCFLAAISDLREEELKVMELKIAWHLTKIIVYPENLINWKVLAVIKPILGLYCNALIQRHIFIEEQL